MDTRWKPPLVALMSLCLIGSADGLFASAEGATGPKVSGPVTGGQQGAPFSAPTIDLEDRGYVAEEFFLDGDATGYQFAAGAEQTPDGRWKTQRHADKTSYRTRILVVRPADPKRFNGSVVVHWQNVTAGYELGTVSGGEILRGYAWVGVSAQQVGVDGFPGPEAAGLRQWDVERYGSLKHPGDAYSYDIFSQAGRAVGPLRASAPVDPMGGLEVKRLIAAGASQSAARLRTYIDGVHPLEQVFDGFIPYIDFGSTIPFDADRTGQRRMGRMSTLIRTDLDVPVIVVNSETETEAYLASRQPDTGKFRFWEVAGTSHVTVAREAVAAAPGLDSPNWLSYVPVYDAAIRHMSLWIEADTLPPVQPRIGTETETESAKTAEDAGQGQVSIARDSFGNARGGVRLPEMAVPTAEHNGRGRPAKEGGNRFAFLYGYSRDFTPEELAKLYPNRDAYLKRYDQALAGAVAAGVVLTEEAPELRKVAASWAERNLPAG